MKIEKKEISFKELINIEKEKLSINLKLIKKKKFEDWHKFLIFLKRKQLIIEKEQHKNRIISRTEKSTDISVKFVIEKLNFLKLLNNFSNISLNKFEPIQNIKANSNLIPKKTDLILEISKKFIKKLNFKNQNKLINNYNIKNLKKLNKYKIKKLKNLINFTNYSNIINNMNLTVIPISIKNKIEPINKFSQDNLIFTLFSDFNAITNVSANLAINSLEIFNFIPQLSKNNISKFLPIINLSCSWDLTTNLINPFEEDYDNNSIYSKYESLNLSQNENKYLPEVIEIYNKINLSSKKFVESIIPFIIQENLFYKNYFEEILNDSIKLPINNILLKEENLLNLPFNFLNKEIDNSLIKFSAKINKINDIINQISDFQYNISNQLLKKVITISIFDKISNIIPILKSFNDNLDENNQNWKNDLNNTIQNLFK